MADFTTLPEGSCKHTALHLRRVSMCTSSRQALNGMPGKHQYVKAMTSFTPPCSSLVHNPKPVFVCCCSQAARQAWLAV
jgi:hypothetical protein